MQVLISKSRKVAWRVGLNLIIQGKYIVGLQTKEAQHEHRGMWSGHSRSVGAWVWCM